MVKTSKQAIAISLACFPIIVLCLAYIAHRLGIPEFVAMPSVVVVGSLACYPVAQAWYKRLGKTLTFSLWVKQMTFVGLVMMLGYFFTRG